MKVTNPNIAGKNTFFEDVIDKHQKLRIERVKNMRKSYEETQLDISKKVIAISDEDSCNDAFDYFSKNEKFRKNTTWKSKLYQKAKELGLEFNKATERFENVVSNAVAL